MNDHKHCWDKMKELNSDHGDCEFCCECKKAYEPGKIKTSDEVWDEAMMPLIEELPFNDIEYSPEICKKINEIIKAVNKLQRP